MELFNLGYVSAYFDLITENLRREINALSDAEIILTDKNDWLVYFSNKYAIEQIELYEERTHFEFSQKNVQAYDDFRRQYYNTEGYEASYKIPFDGNAKVLYYQPSHFYWSSFSVDYIKEPDDENEGYLYYKLSYRRDEVARNMEHLDAFLKERFERFFKETRDMISFVNSDVESFNKSLPVKIETLLKSRKEKADEWCKVTQKLQIPLVLDAASPNVVPMALKKRVKKTIVKPTQKPQSPEYYVGDGDYDNIVNIINSCCMAMERSASTFGKLEEEELRDFITSTLNTHYVDSVTGETFRRRGKTDILITFENAEAFIGECKVWHGVKLLGEALEQLLCYTTWRDLKTAIVIFNKVNKNFDNIQKQTEQWIAENSKSWKRRNGNVWDCVIYSDFHGHDIKVAVCLYDIMVKELPSSKKLIK